jgi:hypothetical protein
MDKEYKSISIKSKGTKKKKHVTFSTDVLSVCHKDRANKKQYFPSSDKFYFKVTRLLGAENYKSVTGLLESLNSDEREEFLSQRGKRLVHCFVYLCARATEFSNDFYSFKYIS